MVPYAAPFELIHTFTLIHDDLPCMDDAGTRRGVPAVHVLFGEATAVLAGDALLNLAFARLAGGAGTTIRTEVRQRLIAIAAGATHRVVEGQVLDLESEGRRLSVAELKVLHSKKTGALLGACLEAGAVLAGLDSERCAKLAAAGVQLGLVFQIRDDLLSATGDPALAGKPLGIDDAADKATYPRLLGVSAAEAMLAEELARCEEMINAAGLAEPGLLLELAQLAAYRDH